MAKPIGNACILIAGFFLMAGAVVAVAVIFLGATLVVLFRKLDPRRPLETRA
jgi:hypothetical protein